MGELKKKEEELTTADLAGRREKTRETERRPQLLSNPARSRSESVLNSPSTTGEEVENRDITERSSVVGDEERNARNAASSTTQAAASPAAPINENPPSPLFGASQVNEFRARWSNIQVAFVDEPRRVVEDADNLVASVMQDLARGFANERERLEKQWDRGDNVSTEDLRIALQRYRSFFDRLLKV
jgi:hypothetical protein